MDKPRLLDLFCGAGGAARGYQQAGFHVTGVDVKPQPRYAGDHFCQADIMDVGLDVLMRELGPFDAIHASPPCQAYSIATRNLGTADRHPRLVEPIRDLLRGQAKPYALENVPGAPIRVDVMLCGSMFGLNVRRHRWFELNVAWSELLSPCAHLGIPIGVYGRGANSWHRKKLGRNPTKDDWREAMGIDWMKTRPELAQAIPPVYAEWIGRQLARALVRELRLGPVRAASADQPD